MKALSSRKTLARLIRTHVNWYDQQAQRHNQGTLSGTWVKYVAKLKPSQWKQLKQGSSALPLHIYHRTLNLIKTMEETVLGKTYRSSTSRPRYKSFNHHQNHKKQPNDSLSKAKHNLQRVLTKIQKRSNRQASTKIRTKTNPSIDRAKRNLQKVLSLHQTVHRQHRGVITSIKAQRRKNRFNVYVNGHYAFPAGINELTRYHLRIGMPITKHLKRVISDSSSVSKMFNRASTRIVHHLRTEREIRTWLHKKYDAPPSDVDKVIKRLKDYYLIDDFHYACEYTRAEIVSGSKGPVAIGRHLRSKGVSDLTIQNALSQTYPAEKQLSVAKRRAKDQFKIKQNVPFPKRIRKIKLNLARKGFSFELASEAIDQCHFHPDVSHQKQLLKRYTRQAFHRYGHRITSNNHYQIKQKIKRFLFRKGFNFDDINQAIENYQENH